VITEKTLYIQLPYMLVCHKPVEFAVNNMEMELKSPGELVMKFNSEALFDGASGGMTCMWRLENAGKVHHHLKRVKARAL
jgi:hypothetical protein